MNRVKLWLKATALLAQCAAYVIYLKECPTLRCCWCLACGVVFYARVL
jgi:hypothetical protein